MWEIVVIIGNIIIDKIIVVGNIFGFFVLILLGIEKIGIYFRYLFRKIFIGFIKGIKI